MNDCCGIRDSWPWKGYPCGAPGKHKHIDGKHYCKNHLPIEATMKEIPKGNMYDWVGPRRNFIGGECPHRCSYCYVKSMYPAVRARYSGELKLLENEFKKPLKSDKPIFIGSCFDMFAKEVPEEWILRVLNYCNNYNNKYLFQSKNPQRFNDYNILHSFPADTILGTTIETNDYGILQNISDAVSPFNRAKHLSLFLDFERMVTIEPILEFGLEDLVIVIRCADPTWVNIGADSKRHNLLEPSWDKVQALIAELEKFTEVKCKSNLERLRR